MDVILGRGFREIFYLSCEVLFHGLNELNEFIVWGKRVFILSNDLCFVRFVSVLTMVVRRCNENGLIGDGGLSPVTYGFDEIS